MHDDWRVKQPRGALALRNEPVTNGAYTEQIDVALDKRCGAMRHINALRDVHWYGAG